MQHGNEKRGNTGPNEAIPPGPGPAAEYSQTVIIRPDGSIEVPWITPPATALILEIYNNLIQKPFLVKAIKGDIYCG